MVFGFFRLLILFLAAVAAGELFGRFHTGPILREPLPTVEIRNIELPTPPISKPVLPSPPSPKPVPAPPGKPRSRPQPSPALVPPSPSQLSSGKLGGQAPPPPAPAAPPPAPSLTERQFYDRYAPAVVQIFCRTSREIFAASGVIVNERGLVLTNAHVGDIVRSSGETNCQARHGNPAERFAGIQIIFIASTTEKIPETDVPQRDVAFLRLVGPEEPFAVAPIGLTFIERGTTLLTLGYPSEFLESITTTSHSNLVFSSLRVDEYADVDGNALSAEAYVSKGGIALQQGSSGTALFQPSGHVVGLIFATTRGATTAEREGIALTTSYMDKIVRLEAGQGLLEFVASH